tara:strand:- start:1551 stop:1691 length:141 start_codon:yes stop_codon:yes gene_type:complete
MKLIISPIMGVHVGFELAEAEVEGEAIGYLLIDFFIIRFQIAWYRS